MATADGYEEKQVRLGLGHGIRMFQRIPSFAETLPHVFEHELAFPCQDGPSSWSVRVELQRIPADGGVSSEIVIQRTDNNREIIFNTELWMGVSPGEHPNTKDKKEALEIYCIRSIKYTGRRVSPGFEAKTKIPRWITSDVLDSLGSLDVQLRVFFRVSGCHRDEAIGAIAEFVGPMTEREMPVSEI